MALEELKEQHGLEDRDQDLARSDFDKEERSKLKAEHYDELEAELGV